MRHFRVLIVEPHRLLAAILRETIERDSALVTMGPVQDAHEAAQAMEQLHPDLLLMDLPAGGGFEAARGLIRSYRHVPVVLIGNDPGVDYEGEAHRAGAGYLTWAQASRELTALIQAVAQVLPSEAPSESPPDLPVRPAPFYADGAARRRVATGLA